LFQGSRSPNTRYVSRPFDHETRPSNTFAKFRCEKGCIPGSAWSRHAKNMFPLPPPPPPPRGNNTETRRRAFTRERGVERARGKKRDGRKRGEAARPICLQLKAIPYLPICKEWGSFRKHLNQIEYQDVYKFPLLCGFRLSPFPDVHHLCVPMPMQLYAVIPIRNLATGIYSSDRY
jgi:hypothetical protein